jgi:hypothetical protein
MVNSRHLSNRSIGHLLHGESKFVENRDIKQKVTPCGMEFYTTIVVALGGLVK